MLAFSVNLEPSGVVYSKPAIAAPGATVTYTWFVPIDPASDHPDKASSVMWHYRSTVDPVAHNAAGLFGPIVITNPGQTNPATGLPLGVDRELFAVFLVSLPSNLAVLPPGLLRFWCSLSTCLCLAQPSPSPPVWA